MFADDEKVEEGGEGLVGAEGALNVEEEDEDFPVTVEDKDAEEGYE